MADRTIRAKERDAIIHSLKAGMTPKIGIQHIQVGRAKEIEALLKDIERIVAGGAAFRLIIGEYGSGKTFFLSVVRAIALEKKLVAVNADLAPNRRLYASGGQGRNLYSELMRNLATRNKPDGNALTSIVERFVTLARQDADQRQTQVATVIQERLAALTEHVGGYDFAKVIEAYWNGYEQGNDALKTNAIRWLRAEYSTKTEAKQDLGVRSIISDTAVYDSLKLMSLFVQQAGYAGLLVILDEMVNLYKINHTQTRIANYEQILRIFNDCLQGTAEHVGFLFGGTPEFLLDPRRGLYSYEALQSRLAKNTFAQQADVIDYAAPALHLANLTPEELFILLKNLRHIVASGNVEQYLVSDEVLHAFLNHCRQTIGEAYFRTPRNTIKSFLDFLTVLQQNPQLAWQTLLPQVAIATEAASGLQSFVTTSDESGLSVFADNAAEGSDDEQSDESQDDKAAKADTQAPHQDLEANAVAEQLEPDNAENDFIGQAFADFIVPSHDEVTNQNDAPTSGSEPATSAKRHDNYNSS